MKNKCNMMYVLFEHNIVMSSKSIFNAITPYNVTFKGNVFSIEDIFKRFKSNYIRLGDLPYDSLQSYTNPTSEEWWYIGRNLIAYKKGDDEFPKIKMLFSGSTVVVDKNWIESYFKYKSYLDTGNPSSYCTSFFVVNTIGNLCYPTKVSINWGFNIGSGFNSKLPIML